MTLTARFTLNGSVVTLQWNAVNYRQIVRQKNKQEVYPSGEIFITEESHVLKLSDMIRVDVHVNFHGNLLKKLIKQYRYYTSITLHTILSANRLLRY